MGLLVKIGFLSVESDWSHPDLLLMCELSHFSFISIPVRDESRLFRYNSTPFFSSFFHLMIELISVGI